MTSSVEVPQEVQAATADALEEIARRWESDRIGWCQGVGHVELYGRHSYCSARAVWQFCVQRQEADDVFTSGTLVDRADAVMAALHKATGCRALHSDVGQYCVQDYNDTAGRTKADIIDLFKNAAKNLRNAQ